MPIKNCQGYGNTTPEKEKIFGEILTHQLQIINSIQHAYHDVTYFYIDATAGCGDNSEIGAMGSPLIAYNLITKNLDENIPYKVVLIERGKHNVVALEKKLKEADRVFIHHGLHEEFLPAFKQHLKKTDFGLLYFDPNGFPDFGFVNELIQDPLFNRIDVLLHFSATSFKRYINSGAFESTDALISWIDKFPKKTKLIGTYSNTAWQWAFLLLTNMQGYKGPRPRGGNYRLFNIRSVRGKEILLRLNHTQEDYQVIRRRWW